MLYRFKLADLLAWCTNLNALAQAGGEPACEAGFWLQTLLEYGERAGAVIVDHDVDTDALGNLTTIRPPRYWRNPALDWETGEINIDVPRAEADPPPAMLIDNHVRLTEIPESR
jgi:hypothetical protein